MDGKYSINDGKLMDGKNEKGWWNVRIPTFENLCKVRSKNLLLLEQAMYSPPPPSLEMEPWRDGGFIDIDIGMPTYSDLQGSTPLNTVAPNLTTSPALSFPVKISSIIISSIGISYILIWPKSRPSPILTQTTLSVSSTAAPIRMPTHQHCQT